MKALFFAIVFGKYSQPKHDAMLCGRTRLNQLKRWTALEPATCTVNSAGVLE